MNPNKTVHLSHWPPTMGDMVDAFHEFDRVEKDLGEDVIVRGIFMGPHDFPYMDFDGALGTVMGRLDLWCIPVDIDPKKKIVASGQLLISADLPGGGCYQVLLTHEGFLW